MMYDVKFIEKKLIHSDDISSEWIKIDLPATTLLFEMEIYENDLIKFKRIKSHTGKISWRCSSRSRGNWLDIIDNNLDHRIFNEYIKYERENKLKRLLNS